MIRLSLPFYLFFLCTGLLGQSGHSTVLNRTVEWNKHDKQSALPFKGEGDVTDTTLVYRFRFPVSSAIEPSSLTLRFENSWMPDVDSLAIVYKNGGDPKYHVIYINKKAFVEVELVPLKIISGTPHRLESFLCTADYATRNNILKNSPVQSRYAEQSILSSGKWVKVSVSESGIHKIPYSQLLDWGFSSPNKVRIFGYGGEMLPEANSTGRPDDLPETAVWHYSNAVYFYAQNNVVWKWNENENMFRHKLHTYASEACYFLTDRDGAVKNITEQTVETNAANTEVTQFDDLRYHEEDFTNFHWTGKLWVSKEWASNSVQKFNFSFPARIISDTVKMFTQAAISGEASGSFQYLHEGKTVTTLNISGSKNFAELASRAIWFKSSAQSIELEIKYGQSSAKGYLDFIDMNVRSELKITGSQLVFRDKRSNRQGTTALFRISGAGNETVVWDVTNRTAIKKLPATNNGNFLEFKTSTSQLKEFVTFNPSGNFPVPARVGDVANQNLHSINKTDYIIVAHKDFHTQAQELADLHFQYHGLNTVIVTPEQIYNEFSWGHQDPVAIRSFAKMIYDRNGGIKYLLLFGDGTYDNRGIKGDNKYHKYNIVTCESEHSTSTSSYVTDDFFCFLDDNESGAVSSSRVDIAVGRFPVESVDEATIMVSKIRKYLEEQTFGYWRKRITFLADDLDNLSHMRQADECAQIIEKNHPEFDVKKIYTDSYPKITSTAGDTYPAASDAVNRTIVNGTLVLNYIGHGGPAGFSHEKVITIPHARKWNNIKELVFFMTFTCELAPFDNHGLAGKSIGEQILLNPYGGAVAMFTTTREVFISNNGTLNRKMHDYLFTPNNDGTTRSIGEIIMHTKQNMGNDMNMWRFVLLGDPAIRLCYPDQYKIELLTINGKSVDEAQPIQARATVQLTGQITDGQGQKNSGFNGEADIIVYDKIVSDKTLANNNEPPFEFQHYPNIIFTGKSAVKNGEFKTEFAVPQDIRYNLDKGKVSMYAHSTGNSTQAKGVFKEIAIGGIDNTVPVNTKGASINLYLNRETFKNGETTGKNPLLFATVEDEQGINVGNGIGHDLLLVIDGDDNNPIVLNDYFQSEIDNFRKGSVVYQLPTLSEGSHELSLKVWDTHNNSSTARLNFTVGDLNELKISNFQLFPVPVTASGAVSFLFDMDEPNSILTVTAEAITLGGQITGSRPITVATLVNSAIQTSISLSSIGITRQGIYFIRFSIVADSGKEAQIVKKIVVHPQ